MSNGCLLMKINHFTNLICLNWQLLLLLLLLFMLFIICAFLSVINVRAVRKESIRSLSFHILGVPFIRTIMATLE